MGRGPGGEAQFALIGLAVLAGCGKSASAPAAGAAPATTSVSVPFVGCAQDGQMGPLAAPTGAAKTVKLAAANAGQLAYYSDGNTGGVLGPRGWHCFGTYGSSGATLYVAPQPIGSSDVLATRWTGAGGPAIIVALSSGDTSGRFTVAQAIARVFPAHAAFAQSVIAEGVEPAGDFPSGPFANDRLTYRGDAVVEYVTQAGSAGLGTWASGLTPDSDPIYGVAILTGQTPDLATLAVRLTPALRALAPAVVSQFEADNPPGAPPAAGAAAPVQDPRAVTQSFYAALGRADGQSASSLVVPEKRGSGPFSAAALTRFYGAMREPIRLTTATASADGSVAVQYRYVYASGKVCDGAAVVQTVERGGATLIASIRAANGC